MITLTRKIGQRVLIGPAIEVEAVEVRRSGVVLQLRGVEDESNVQLVDTPLEDQSPSIAVCFSPTTRGAVVSAEGTSHCREATDTTRIIALNGVNEHWLSNQPWVFALRAQPAMRTDGVHWRPVDEPTGREPPTTPTSPPAAPVPGPRSLARSLRPTGPPSNHWILIPRVRLGHPRSNATTPALKPEKSIASCQQHTHSALAQIRRPGIDPRSLDASLLAPAVWTHG